MPLKVRLLEQACLPDQNIQNLALARIETDDMARAAKLAAEDARKRMVGWNVSLGATSGEVKSKLPEDRAPSSSNEGSELRAPSLASQGPPSVVGPTAAASISAAARASVGFAISNLDYAMANLPSVTSMAAASLPARLSQVSSLWGGSGQKSSGQSGHGARISNCPPPPVKPGLEVEVQQSLTMNSDSRTAAGAVANPVPKSNASPSSLVILTIKVLDSEGAVMRDVWKGTVRY